MKLSVPFLLNNQTLIDNSDEIMIYYDNKSKIDNLAFFGKTYPNHRINIYFDIVNDFDIISILEESKLQKFVIVTDYFVKPETLQIFNDKQWDYYILVPAKNFYDLKYYIKMGVSDLFIADDLWHHLPAVRKLCNNMNIRMHGDKSGLYGKQYTKDDEEYYITFIPRPEDYALLDKYVDVLQFNMTEPLKLKVLYKVWYSTHRWYGRINELYLNSQKELDLYNVGIGPDYTESKIKCGARCLFGSKCRKCRHIYELAEAALDKGVEIKIGTGWDNE